MSNDNTVYDESLHILVVGGRASGKTSLIQRYLSYNVSTIYTPTHGVDVYHKNIPFTSQKNLFRVDFYEVADCEKKIALKLLNNINGIIFVLDQGNWESITAIDEWRELISLHFSDFNIPPLFLVLTKIDQNISNIIPPEVYDNYVRAAKFARCYKVSSFGQTEFVTQAFDDIIQILIHRGFHIKTQNSETQIPIKPLFSQNWNDIP